MSDANYTLNLSASPNEALGYPAYVFTGTLTADRNIIVPTNKKLYLVVNNTTGGHNLVIKTSGGTGVTVAVASGPYTPCYCDGTNVVAVGAAGGGSSTLSGETDVVLTSPADNDVLTYEASSSKWKNKPAAGGGGGTGAWSAASGKRQLIVNLANMVWVSGLSSASTPENQSLGTDVAMYSSTSVFASWSLPDATHGGGVTLTTSTADSLAGIHSYNTTAYAPVAMGHNLEFFGSMYITGTSDIRFWCGLGSNALTSAGTLGAHDSPSGQSADWIGFRYSTVAGDTVPRVKRFFR
jgi:hypothetical protein